MKCKLCKLETDEEKQRVEVENVREELEELGIGFNEEKASELKDLCPACTRLTLHRNALTLLVETHLRKPTQEFNDRFEKLLDLLVVDGGFRTHQRILVLMGEELDGLMPSLSHQARLLAYRIMFKYAQMWEPPFHVDDVEKTLMNKFRKGHNYSVGDLAFMFDRSKETVSRTLKG